MRPGADPDTPWELVISDGFRVTAPLAAAIRQAVAHLDAIPIAHDPGGQ